MTVYRFEIAYDGAPFSGWQIQPQARTVQGEVHKALQRLTGLPQVKVNGASRTDAGVHALGQVVSLPWPQEARAFHPHELMRALGAILPEEISVLRMERVEALDHQGRPFHARHCARGKRYRYRIWSHRVQNPLARRDHWHPRGAPDNEGWDRAHRAAEILVGEHDFAGFRASDCVAPNTVRTLHRVELIPPTDGRRDWCLVVEGTAFLKNMVRVLAGTLLDVACGRIDLERLQRALDSGDRALAGQTAPAHGLCLEEVFYPDFPWAQPRWTLPPRSGA